MNFNLNAASEKTEPKGPQYQRPGIYDNVRVSGVNVEKTSVQQIPYLQLQTTGPNGELGKSGKMFLSTETKEGKKTSAWSVTARNLTDLIMATHNVDETAAKSMINVNSIEELVKVTSTLLVGRPFRAKFKGTENDRGSVYSELAGVESMNVAKENSRLRFDESRDIVKYVAPAPTAEAATSDLPF